MKGAIFDASPFLYEELGLDSEEYQPMFEDMLKVLSIMVTLDLIIQLAAGTNDYLNTEMLFRTAAILLGVAVYHMIVKKIISVD